MGRLLHGVLCRWSLSCHGVSVVEFVSSVVEAPLGYSQELTAELKRLPREVTTRAREAPLPNVAFRKPKTLEKRPRDAALPNILVLLWRAPPLTNNNGENNQQIVIEEKFTKM